MYIQNDIFINPHWPLYFGVGNDKFDSRVRAIVEQFQGDSFNQYLTGEGASKVEELVSILIGDTLYKLPEFDGTTITKNEEGKYVAKCTEFEYDEENENLIITSK